jgi:hypothetical protein
MSMSITRRLLPVFLAVAAPMLIVKCVPNDPSHVGTGTETENVAGILYNADGSRAANATVHIRKKSTLADTSGILKKVFADSVTVTTDDSGKFAIDSLDTGTYVIEGSDGGNNLALNDSVVVPSDTDSTVVVPPDTLKPAGAIKGVIKLSEGGDPRKVFVLAFGIDRFARVNADGSFKFEKLAEGPYDLRLISSLANYDVLDTFGVPVQSEDTTDLGAIELPSNVPNSLTASVDTLSKIVVLSWEKPEFINYTGYYVYKSYDPVVGYGSGRSTLLSVATFVDSSFSPTDSGRTVYYCVTGVGADSIEGALSKVLPVLISFKPDSVDDLPDHPTNP